MPCTVSSRIDCVISSHHWRGHIMRRAAYFVLLFVSLCRGMNAAEVRARREWKIGDQTREALIYVPAAAKTTPAPVVFVFHGHGGMMRGATVSMPFHQQWP